MAIAKRPRVSKAPLACDGRSSIFGDTMYSKSAPELNGARVCAQVPCCTRRLMLLWCLQEESAWLCVEAVRIYI